MSFMNDSLRASTHFWVADLQTRAWEVTDFLAKNGFTTMVQGVCLVILVIKVCHLYPNMWPLPGRRVRAIPLPRGSVIGHRGSCQEGVPENTLASFLDAVVAGVDIVELDVWLTKDKQICVFHDDNFARMTSNTHKGLITETNYADFPEIVPGILQRSRIADVVDGDRLAPLLPEGGSPLAKKYASRYKSANGSGSNTDFLWKHIPLFEEVLAHVPEHISIIIEVKDHNPEMVTLLHALIRRQSKARQDNLFWFSLREGLNNSLRMVDSTIPSITSLPNILRVFFLYALGLAPFIDVRCDVFGIDVRTIDQERVNNERSLQALPQWGKNIIAFLFQGSPPSLCLLPTLYSMLRKKGVPVYFLGVDSIPVLHNAVVNGASGVLTDKPNMLCAHIKAMRLQLNQVNWA